MIELDLNLGYVLFIDLIKGNLYMKAEVLGDTFCFYRDVSPTAKEVKVTIARFDPWYIKNSEPLYHPIFTLTLSTLEDSGSILNPKIKDLAASLMFFKISNI